ncbi:hypothetical protein [Hephaestia mangrovi]|jgi:hypothetical protein|uniref:hypothetical protein n=1 Tax=Hephaestia mangrovi TaxID=2873268 RepID=UPI001CA776D0|nr:hypothetical protein [Hephaestia mangrovi]MBY8828157.1 hypothetical protein [Hephaestia mangrovi]
MTDRPTGLDDPAAAAHAWARFRRVLGWMALAIAAIDAAAIVAIDHFYGPLSLLTIIATAIGFGLTMLLAAALMGLVFMSAGTGHDQAVEDFAKTQKGRRRF